MVKKSNQTSETNNAKHLQSSVITNFISGSLQEQGCYKCCNCGQKIYLEHKKILQNCPKCNCRVFEID